MTCTTDRLELPASELYASALNLCAERESAFGLALVRHRKVTRTSSTLCLAVVLLTVNQ